jgi:hypothetical protein
VPQTTGEEIGSYATSRPTLQGVAHLRVSLPALEVFPVGTKREVTVCTINVRHMSQHCDAMPSLSKAAPSLEGLVVASNRQGSTVEIPHEPHSATESVPALVQARKRIKVYPERANRVRAKKPKSRAGCKTCK